MSGKKIIDGAAEALDMAKLHRRLLDAEAQLRERDEQIAKARKALAEALDAFEARTPDEAAAHDRIRAALATTPNAPGLWSQLTPEQREQALAYRGPEASGEQSMPKIARATCTEAGEDARIEVLDEQNWKDWSGGPCPVPEYERPEVRLRSGGTTQMQANRIRWHHTGGWDDVVAYRTHRALAEPQEKP